ncbi:hypothetical protein BDB00DRAFT_806273 [Zychaea mexicana]|uniref:uncharacterized protein n=1 Tax=Zychaea mexicana TaxID=64656 RepID=UPI0022FEB69E|nr:uncharacterized protein BDB00DRAFT_806273 [Zychaea mexicana]KAI9496975.1 hypothetical protein BDB00DRAFT_806273 [Zychaea mexicana]
MLTASLPRLGFPISSPARRQQQQREQQLQLQQQQELEKQEQQQQQAIAPKPKKKKGIRQAVGIIVNDRKTGKILMLKSRKREGALVLPRGERDDENKETSDDAVIRILSEEAGLIRVDKSPIRLGTYCEGNKRGKTIAHHWMYEIRDAKFVIERTATKASTELQEQQEQRERVWVTFKEALEATLDRPMSHLALKNSSFASSQSF